MIEIRIMTNKDEGFWPVLGPFLSSRAVAGDLGGPIYNDDGRVWFVASLNGCLAGIAAVDVKRSAGVLKHAYVYPQYRKRGVYSQLLQTRMEYIKDLGLAKIKTRAAPTTAHRFVAMGFVEVGRRGKYVDYEKEIGSPINK